MYGIIMKQDSAAQPQMSVTWSAMGSYISRNFCLSAFKVLKEIIVKKSLYPRTHTKPFGSHRSGGLCPSSWLS